VITSLHNNNVLVFKDGGGEGKKRKKTQDKCTPYSKVPWAIFFSCRRQDNILSDPTRDYGKKRKKKKKRGEKKGRGRGGEAGAGKDLCLPIERGLTVPFGVFSVRLATRGWR